MDILRFDVGGDEAGDYGVVIWSKEEPAAPSLARALVDDRQFVSELGLVIHPLEIQDVPRNPAPGARHLRAVDQARAFGGLLDRVGSGHAWAEG